MIKPKIPTINDYVNPSEKAIFPNEYSKYTLSVPGLISEYSKNNNPLSGKLKVLPYMIGCLHQIKKSYKIINNNPDHVKTIYSDELMDKLKDLAKKHGISEIGFCKVTPEVIFKDRFVEYENAIVMTMQMKPEIIQTAPSKKSMKEVFRTYYALCRFANIASKALQKHGYGVHPGPALGGDTNYGLLALKAGLGEVGKHGLLITEKDGSSIRLGSIFTSMELAADSDSENEHSWIREFCEKCNRCVNACPTNAIYKETVIDDKGRKKHIDIKRCAIPFSNQYGCTVCVKACTFFKGDYNKIKHNFDN